MTKDEYFQSCMDAWVVGWESCGDYRPFDKKALGAQHCLAAFVKQFPEKQYVSDRERGSSCKISEN